MGNIYVTNRNSYWNGYWCDNKMKPIKTQLTNQDYYSQGYLEASNKWKKMFDDYNKKLKDFINRDDLVDWDDFAEEIDKLSKEVMGE